MIGHKEGMVLSDWSVAFHLLRVEYLAFNVVLDSAGHHLLVLVHPVLLLCHPQAATLPEASVPDQSEHSISLHQPTRSEHYLTMT